MSFRFGIDLGGTTAKMGVVGPSGKIVWQASVASGDRPTASALVREISKVAKPALRRYRIKRVGVGVAGDINFEKGIVRVSPNLGWKNVLLKKMLRNNLKCEVVVDNDANVAGWGLYKIQAPRNVNSMITLTLGTGVGGGIVLNRHIHRGATGSAGEIGHMVMDPEGPRCNCGQRGCLEAYAGGFYIARTLKEKLAEGAKSSLRENYLEDPGSITPYLAAKAAERGDSFAKKTWHQVGVMLGRAIGDLIYILNPDAVYLTGGVSQAENLILQPLLRELKKRPFKTPVTKCKIKIAREAPNMGIIGAALL